MSLLLMTAYDTSKGVINPSSIAGLQLWLKADSLALADNDPIGTWEDSVGTNDATQGTAANKPTYKTNIINGRPVVRCDGGDVMALASLISLSGAYTLYAVGARATSQAWIPFGADTSPSVIMIFSDNNIYIADDTADVNAPYTGSDGNILVRVHRSAVGATNKFAATGMAEVNVGIRSTINIDRILGRPAFTQFSTGDFGEILLWNRDLTAGEMTQVESYLGRWGVSL